MNSLFVAAGIFLTTPSPMEMPKAEAYLVKERSGPKEPIVYRLEDRFDRTDLWISRSVDGLWRDYDGREFMLASLGVAPPPLSREPPVTRAEYVKGTVPIGRKDEVTLATAIEMLSPVATTAEFTRPRQRSRGYKDVRYYQGTNTSAIVCAYLPEKSERWSLATWTLAPDDDFAEQYKTFESEFLEKRDEVVGSLVEPPKPEAEKQKPDGRNPKSEAKNPNSCERELLRADARHSVAMYDDWRVTDGDEFTVLDNIGNARSFTTTLTNDLKRMRAAYAAVMPSPVDGSNVLCVARIFASREEYLDALEANDHSDMEWSAAYWSPRRRELVAYLPPDGSEKLIETIRHEAFHQYLSYATSMIPTSPWLNEGYAQYFEEGPDGPKFADPADMLPLAEAIPGILAMDYDEFYSGSNEERRLKYRLALSIAVFLEKGASKVRFDPFKNVKRDYIKVLFSTKDMRKATAAAFGSQDNLDLFVREWTKYWKDL